VQAVSSPSYPPPSLNKQAEEHKLESELLLWNRYQLAFLKDDTDASAIELGQTTSGLTIFPCPTYVRGEAYLMLHDGKAAARTFRSLSIMVDW
jgi:hypothetical protein